MEAYRIFEWNLRYEVTDKGGEWKGQGKKRANGLRYIRLTNHRYSIGPGRQKLRQLAGERAREVSDVFNDLLQFAGSHGPELRGWILNDMGQPATIEDLAFHLSESEEDVKYYLEILTNPRLGWLKKEQFPENFGVAPGTPGNSPELPGGGQTKNTPLPESPGALYNETETESNRDLTKTETKPTPPGAGNISDSDSDFPSGKDSGSDSMNAQSFCLRLSEILPGWNKSDMTTFNNLGKHLQEMLPDNPGIFGKALELARSSKGLTTKKPKARFVAACKDRFGFSATVGWDKRRGD